GCYVGYPLVMQVAEVLSIMFVLSGFTAVQQALLRRVLLFDALLRAQIASSVISSTAAVLAALEGVGYWALVIRATVDPLIYAIVVWVSAGWVSSSHPFA